MNYEYEHYKKEIFNILDNKIEYYDLSDYIMDINEENLSYKTIFNALKLNKSITTLNIIIKKQYFDDMPKGYEFIQHISKFINNKSNIKTLIITSSNTSILTLNKLKPLFDVLQYNTYIKTLDLSNSDIITFLNEEFYKINDYFHNLNIYYSNLLYSNKIGDENLDDEDKATVNDSKEQLQKQLLTILLLYIKHNPFFNLLKNNKTITTLNLSVPEHLTQSIYNDICLNKNYYINDLLYINEFIQKNKSIKTLNIKNRICKFKEILHIIKNNECLEEISFTLYKESSFDKNYKQTLQEYYNENEYLKRIEFNFRDDVSLCFN